MPAPQVSPIKAGRRSNQRNTFGPLIVNREAFGTSCLDSPSSKPIQNNGDYQVLQQGVEQQRRTVRRETSALASTLGRLGDHHVRNKEYDEAMNAFTEALHEKRNVFSQVDHCGAVLQPVSAIRNRGNSTDDDGDGDSLLDSIVTNPEQLEQEVTSDGIIQTLRSIGNVHSLRGEQDEAMRYYSEVTSLRASFKTNPDTVITSGQSRLSHSLDEDNPAMVSELNEDIRALDDLFRSISFRNGELRDVGEDNKYIASTETEDTLSDSNRKRRRGGAVQLESKELFQKSSSSISTDSTWREATNDELSKALDFYRSILESYTGQKLDNHDEKLNSFALRADVIHHNKKRVRLDRQKDAQRQPSEGEVSREEEFELALNIYKHALEAQEEMRVNPLQDSDAEPYASAKVASTLIRMGSIYYKLNDVDEELRMYQEAKSVYQHAFGENHAYVAGTRKNIGMVLAERGEYEASMNEFDKAKQIYSSINESNEENRDVASAISCMANVKNRMGELDDALKHYIMAGDIYKSILKKAQQQEEEDVTDAVRDLTSTLKIIGMVHSKKGDLNAAMTFFDEAMGILRSCATDNCTSIQEGMASVLTRIACIQYKKKEFEKALLTYSEAYDLATAAHHGSTQHPDIASILHYKGGIYHKQGKLSEAISYYQEAVSIYQATLGPSNPAAAMTLVCMGSIHYKKKQLDRAILFYREAFRLNRDAYGLHHPDVAPTLKSIGMILAKKGDFVEAYDVFRDVLSIKCTVHGTGHPEVANAYKSLGNVHYKRGELADAEREYRHALNIYRRAKGEDHKDTVAVRTTIEHLRQHMRARGRKRSGVEKNHRRDGRHSNNTDRIPDTDERSC